MLVACGGYALSHSNGSTLQTYLDELDTYTLLTRDEELALFKKIEKHQLEILFTCVGTEVFRTELLIILGKQETDLEGLTKVSRLLHDNPTPEQEEHTLMLFTELLGALEAGDEETAKEILEDINLTGAIIQKLVASVKKKHQKLTSLLALELDLKRYFQTDSMLDVQEAIKELKEVQYFEDSVRASKYHEFETYRNLRSNLSLNHLKSDDDLEGLQEVYHKILKQEAKMKEHRDVLVKHNLRLVVAMAKKYQAKGRWKGDDRNLTLEDMIQEGAFGLMKAIDKYDSTRGLKLSTYATWWINQTIGRSISNTGKTVRIPTNIETFLNKLNAAKIRLMFDLGRDATWEELAWELDTTPEKVEEMHTIALYKVVENEKLSDGPESESGFAMSEIEDEDTLTPSQDYELRDFKNQIRKDLMKLPPEQVKYIMLKYGIGVMK